MQEKNTSFQLFASRLRESMNNKSLTQKQLEELSGIPQSNISAYLREKMEPKASVLYQLSAILDVSMDYLWGGDEKAHSSLSAKDTQEEIIRLKSKLISARKTLEGAYHLAIESLKVEENNK